MGAGANFHISNKKTMEIRHWLPNCSKVDLLSPNWSNASSVSPSGASLLIMADLFEIEK